MIPSDLRPAERYRIERELATARMVTVTSASEGNRATF